MQVVFGRYANFSFEIFASSHFLSSPNHCNVKIRASAHIVKST
nr:MAG TPA: hypothetical protein [Caudoviricetes sp.]